MYFVHLHLIWIHDWSCINSVKVLFIIAWQLLTFYWVRHGWKIVWRLQWLCFYSRIHNGFLLLVPTFYFYCFHQNCAKSNLSGNDINFAFKFFNESCLRQRFDIQTYRFTFSRAVDRAKRLAWILTAPSYHNKLADSYYI